MPSIILAAAQAHSTPGNIAANLVHHMQWMERAAQESVQLLIFPELSLTGYERGLARQLAISIDDPVLHPLREKARQLGISVVVGVPLKDRSCDIVHIAALTFDASGAVHSYTKQHLHLGEEVVFASGSGGAALSISDHAVALAVCADFSHASHAHNAATSGADIYVASALITGKAYAEESGLLQSYARQHGMAIMLANHAGITGGWTSAGKSAFWNEHGACVIAAPDDREMLVIAEKKEGCWSGKLLVI